MMTPRERILAVYRGETPDVVPFMLDLSHWYYHRHRLPWDLGSAFEEPEYALIDYHRRMGAGFYQPNLAAFYTAHYGSDVQAELRRETRHGATEICWRLQTPLGAIERRRIWEEQSYSWAISQWGVETEEDLRVLGHALGSVTYTPRWERYQAWNTAVGDAGVVYLSAGYSAMGQLLHYWMGFPGVVFAAADWPHTLHEVVERINASNLGLIDLLASSPAEIIMMGDNFCGEMQPPHFFAEWSAPYYREAIRRLHMAGKHVAVHLDGKLRGALRMIREAGADCADAVTPRPMGDLSPRECREEAGPDFILSGGVSPDLWLPGSDIEVFKAAVIAWLELKAHGPALIANAGDQVPPGAEETRIALMRELVERHGRF